MSSSNPPSNFIPSARAMQVAHLLKDLRPAGMSQAAAGRAMGWSTAKVGHIETCRNGISVTDTARLLDLYGVAPEIRDKVLRLAGEVDQIDWWAEFSGVFNGPYVALEDVSERISEWAPQVIPGLLQTPEYAQALRTEVNEESPPSSWVRARISRQLVLTRADTPPVQFHAVIGEAALRSGIGGPEVMRGQFTRLLLDAKRANVVIQVLPTGSGGHPGMTGSFSILAFGEQRPDKVFVDSAAGDIYVENQHQVDLSKLAFSRITRMALSPEESAAFIEKFIK
ncbi:helix-turn-helix domain-containing protein [Actinocorallia sp. API 0066]|uniref:helix-turn-helix domain-containing protein n=1 Tax=Actinocorallia sp. API 0066 TaxID=2896846 RepID=UPI001E5F68E1|nr:helix-turn-helix transcriptional regulator [Actinocorallia sp. API 0066]MCD0453256.1 helix-turn-helix domain-containing protein [Actinocorallia sp. API 0066]